jgi:membrane protein YdbS with pleckstrin-like domain
VTDPSRTLSDIPDEGDPATSRTTPAEHAQAAEAPVEPADTSSSVVDGHTTSDAVTSDVVASDNVGVTTTAATAVSSALGFPEGEPQSLHPAHLKTQLIAHWITIGVMSVVAFTIISSLTLGGALRGVRLAVVPGLGVTVISLIAWWGWRYNRLEHHHTSYVISAAGCEIRRGVLWRRIITVPLSRIQHTDVTQGPLQRAYGLATLALYTAGTEHAKVDLSGLSFETATAIRQYLFERSEAHAPTHHGAR